MSSTTNRVCSRHCISVPVNLFCILPNADRAYGILLRLGNGNVKRFVTVELCSPERVFWSPNPQDLRMLLIWKEGIFRDKFK